MNAQEKYFDFGIKYGVPLTIILSTFAMKKAKGLGNLAVFALVTPLMLGYLYSLKKVKNELKSSRQIKK
ncbi:MAG: hypothetical protein WD398_12435 [Cyclobacteriaceae bacterium]